MALFMASITIQVYTLYISLLHTLAVLWYHIRHGIFSFSAIVFKQTHLLFHPDEILPSFIGPANDTTIHSFIPTAYFLQHFNIPAAPPTRQWCHPEDLNARIASELPITIPIILQGTLSGPPLRQGMVVLQQDGQIYIGEEIGRWPTHEDLILTVSVNLRTGGTFSLFIPTDLFDRSNMCDYTPRSLLRTPFSLLEVVNKSRSIERTPSFDSSPV